MILLLIACSLPVPVIKAKRTLLSQHHARAAGGYGRNVRQAVHPAKGVHKAEVG
jgi:hypothetical protein